MDSWFSNMNLFRIARAITMDKINMKKAAETRKVVLYPTKTVYPKSIFDELSQRGEPIDPESNLFSLPRNPRFLLLSSSFFYETIYFLFVIVRQQMVARVNVVNKLPLYCCNWTPKYVL